MNRNQAIELLKYHSLIHDDFENVKWEKGFLGMLRPFQGELLEENFIEIMELLKVIKNELIESNINRDVMSAFWGICHYGRVWGLETEGMLQRNKLLSEEQTELLSEWISCISYTVTCLIEGNEEEAFLEYTEYCERKNK